MGIKAGFDMVPRLGKNTADEREWESFLAHNKDSYKNDPRLKIKINSIEFDIGEHPQLPFEGYQFLRFSSMLSREVRPYIDKVSRIAKEHFKSRIKSWNEAFADDGFYDWQEVHDSLKSYEHVCWLQPICGLKTADGKVAWGSRGPNDSSSTSCSRLFFRTATVRDSHFTRYGQRSFRLR